MCCILLIERLRSNNHPSFFVPPPHRPSPKLVLVILQLCRVALPIMSAEDCELIELPTWGEHMQQALGTDFRQQDGKSLMIASLLLAKLGDFLVPGK